MHNDVSKTDARERWDHGGEQSTEARHLERREEAEQ
jgi:hypothetical protein